MTNSMLIVDDDAIFCRVLAKGLLRKGLASMSADTYADAIALIEENSFSHAIIDLNLGASESGLHLLRHLHQQQPSCRAMMLTGFASIATAVEATRSGAVQYLPKPATLNEIIAALFEQEECPEPPIADKPPSPKRMEWEYIQRILLKNDGNISATANELGMHRRTLQRKLAKHPPR